MGLIPPPPDPAERAAWERGVAEREASEAAFSAAVRSAARDLPVAVPMRHHVEVITYLDMGQVGAWFGVSGATVSKWRSRYASDHPCPEPDAMTGQIPGWLPKRETEWRKWHAARTGQGAPGRPKPRRAQPE